MQSNNLAEQAEPLNQLIVVNNLLNNKMISESLDVKIRPKNVPMKSSTTLSTGPQTVAVKSKVLILTKF